MHITPYDHKVPYQIPTPNNMGVVRYLLALAVVLAHFQYLAGHDFFVPLSSYSGVGGFFALSGFLIYGSYLRKPGLKSYILSRARRLLPAYWITVLFFAILLCSVSTLGWREYFTSSQFWRYVIYNMAFANFAQPSLPGVFDGNEFMTDAVNGSLWTMKVEWCLYLTPPLVAWIVKRLKARPVIVFAAIYILACGYRIFFTIMYDATESEIYSILERQFFGQLSYFYVGVICYYLFNSMMRYKWGVIAIASVLLAVCDFIPYGNIVLHPIAISVVVIWLSMVGKWGTWEGKRDNISYNIYLLHFPIIQLFVYFRGDADITTVPAILVCLGITWLLAGLLNIVEVKIRHGL